jgi:hypothetical protein
VLCAKIGTGAALYLCGAACLRLDAFREFMEILRRIAGKIGV